MKGFNKQTYADRRFMDIGVEMQMDANNWWAAKHAFERSCMLCCAKGVGAIQCATCPIREAMLTNARIFSPKMPKQEKKWVEKERLLL